MLDVHSIRIAAVVKDFNFKPVETFYDHNFPSLTKIQLEHTLKSRRQSTSFAARILIIHLEFSPDYLEHLASYPADYLAPYWMNPAKHPKRKALPCGVLLAVWYNISQKQREGWKCRKFWLARWARKKSSQGDDHADRIYDVMSMRH